MMNPFFTRVVAAPIVPPVHPPIPVVGVKPFTTWKQIGSYYPSSAYTHSFWQLSNHPKYMPVIPKTLYYPYHYPTTVHHYHFPSMHFQNFNGKFHI